MAFSGDWLGCPPARGRMATAHAYAHFGLAAPAAVSANLGLFTEGEA